MQEHGNYVASIWPLTGKHFLFCSQMAFPNYSYGMTAGMGYGHPPTNHGKIPGYQMNSLGLGATGMDMIHPINPYHTPGKCNTSMWSMVYL